MNVFSNILSFSESTPKNDVFSVVSPHGVVERNITYELLMNAVQNIDKLLSEVDSGIARPKHAIVMANSPEWVACDIAMGVTHRIEIPVPTIFSAEQAENLIKNADSVLVDDIGMAVMYDWEKKWNLGKDIKKVYVDSNKIYCAPEKRQSVPELMEASLNVRLVPEECKIVHTSGTTNNPKGVRISQSALWNQISALKSMVPGYRFSRYVSIVPLSLLIEQITAIYLFLSYGGCLYFPSAGVPLLGSKSSMPDDLIKYFTIVEPDFVVVSPSIVERLHSIGNSLVDPSRLVKTVFGLDAPPFIACGNAPIATEILTGLHDMGLQVYEGYGLSENTSVVSWNSPSQFKYGTVGKPLDHVTLKLSDENELLVKSASLYLGYTATDPSSCVIDDDGWLHTGDIGELDSDGYVKVVGRKKHVLITASGRNVSPEWVESQYKRLPFIRNVAVFGNDLPFLMAVFIVNRGELTNTEMRRAIDNYGLEQFSDVERVRQYVLLESNPQVRKEYITITGDPIRPKLWERLTEEFDVEGLKNKSGESISA
ncbi:AMP-binding protein [Teredinibacter franksiae]|uniref:AMP-binding protein n=1 Tax=Teredinibacter franksiae TaxID=2761453 RepID=UPI001624CD56|nr:AMP-binding protein [Teredinibacter franksiae]